MKTKTLAGSALVAVAAALLWLSPARVQAEAVEPKPAPAWELKNLAGEPVKAADYAGKVVVVDFWATWCGPCRAEIPGYVSLQEKYGDKGLVIVGVSLDRKGPAVVKDFAAEQKINYPLVMGDDAVIEAFGGIEAIPTTFIIDREGQIREKKVGAMPEEQFEALVKKYL